MQHQRDAGRVADTLQPHKIQLRLASILAVRIADGHGQGIDPRAPDKVAGLPRVGIEIGIGRVYQPIALRPANRAQFRLHRNTHRMADLDHVRGLAHILLAGQPGPVKHYRGKTIAYRPDNGRGTLPVVQVQHHRHVRSFRYCLDGRADVLERHVGKMHLGDTEDHRRAPGLRGPDDGLGEVQVDDVERAYRIPVRSRMPEDRLQIDK